MNMTRAQQSSIQSTLTKSNKALERDIVESINASSRSLRDDIAILSAEIKNSSLQQRKYEIETWRRVHDDQLHGISDELSKAVEQRMEAEIANRILHSLYFPLMNDRYERVARAHESTFEWVFDADHDLEAPWTNFVPWLRSAEDHISLYWVTGKAGSGKSTLMRYLCDDEHTQQHLHSWAGPFPLICGKSFFWNPGSPIQRSLRGLLQTLLHQVLSQERDLIKVALPWHWQAYELDPGSLGPWVNRELIDAFRKLIDQTQDRAKIFLLIDGLDEFEGDDAARSEVVTLFQLIAGYRHVKVCISSRPWLIFEDAFRGQPSLLLQHLTYGDISNYVNAEIGANSNFRLHERGNPEGCSKLVQTIVDKADGVFLWVFLVVRSLLEGLRDGDSIAELQRRLESMPSDLDEYFKQMMGTLDRTYLQQASHLFQIALKADSLSLLEYSYTQEEDIKYADKMKIERISEQEVHERKELMARRLNSRCK